ncbi:hypothetical protein GGR51DRAFT_500479 [Nemania sp. FL0031]|nr:hypothetical protein GGR51DRAFT_500479 [Nemania sp. FL0031]
MATSPKRITYRLRRCPLDADAKRCATLLSLALPDTRPEMVRIHSLATNLNPWERPPTKIATLTFETTPTSLTGRLDRNEWILPVGELEESLILDTHFLGFTPLNEVVDGTHELDCIAISGLASHPFGSWQPKGEDKSFMWLRDELPRVIPASRAILYGYDTTLVNSKSFQTIADIASSLVNLIKANGWYLSKSRPLVFLAHSLGGIVLKEAFTMMAIGDDMGRYILDHTLGGIFFGVPSYGMKTSHLHAMVRGQVNEQIVSDLSTNSEYLRVLDDNFSGLLLTRHMRLYWAYETKMSPTVKKHENGRYSRSGPEDILVPQDSATRKSHQLRTPTTFPINENHSDMVKFRQDDPNLQIVLSKLRETNKHGSQLWEKRKQKLDLSTQSGSFPPEMRNESERHKANRLNDWRLNEATQDQAIKDLISSIEIFGRDNRLDTIDENFSHTFDWIFNEHSGLVRWLSKEGSGMFWIHGKPASGKSTLMKFIYNRQQTWELLYKFSSDALPIKAAFFFHDRGVVLQKSFEGLLKSVLHQIILSNSRNLGLLIVEKLSSERQTTDLRSKIWTVNELESCLRFLLRQTQVRLDLFFVFDALDEYDGDPEFVCRLLKALMDVVQNSLNTLKILFSSRPWDIFKQHFRNLQSLQLQDYTQNDIREFCLGSIELEGEDVSSALKPLAPVVMERANGVFLWVKLVLRELTTEAANGKRGEQLSEVLDAIPDDLGQYYTRIVQRIPERFRWEAYVIFQVLTTNHYRFDYELLDLVRIISCSRSSTYHGALENYKSPRLLQTVSDWDELGPRNSVAEGLMTDGLRIFISKLSMHLSRGKRTYYLGSAKRRRHESQITTMTGGLVEFVKPVRGRSHPKVQLVHQTVLEFSTGHDFKRIMFGNRAATVHDNGYSFLARYWAVRQWDLDEFGSYMFYYERTSGRSLKHFIDSIPHHAFPRIIARHSIRVRLSRAFRSLRPSVPRTHDVIGPLGLATENSLQIYLDVIGPLGLATENSLQIYLDDTFQMNPEAFRETKEVLLSSNPFELGPQPQHVLSEAFSTDLKILRFLLDNGYTVEKEPQALQRVLLQILWDDHRNSFERELMYQEYLEAKANILIRYGALATVLIKVPEWWKWSMYEGRCFQAIHIATTIELIDCLIEMGVNINTPDDVGSLPLDYAFGKWYYLRFSTTNTLKARRIQTITNTQKARSIQTIAYLIKRGGTTTRTAKQTWIEYLEVIKELGLEENLIRDCFQRLFPDTEAVGNTEDQQ